MAEALGTAASIIAVIQLAAAVASLSYEYIGGVARAPSELQRFMNELKSLTAVLSKLQVFSQDNPGTAASWGLDGELRRCTEDMKALKAKLEPKKNWWGAALLRLQWPLGEKETLDYIWRIERLKSHFMLAMAVETQIYSKEIEKNVQDIKRDIRLQGSGMSEQQYNLTVLNWLYPYPHDEKHREISGRRQKNTGEWILKTEEVQDWLDIDNRNTRLLWGHGIPGAGKTFISSFIIDHLRDKGQCLVYLYFDYNDQDQQKPVQVLSSFLKQISCQRSSLPEPVKELYERLGSKQEGPTLEDLYTTFIRVAESFSQTFVVCDALDESDFETQRKTLLPLFLGMENSGIRLFLTSREHPEDIQDFFQDSPKIRLWAKDDDITCYIKQKIDENPRARRLISQGKCEDRIIEQLKSSANGMFLLVSFQVKYLCQQATVKQILVELDRLAESSNKESPMDPTYDRVLNAIRLQTPNCVELAIRILTWIVKARNVLKVRALQLAVSVEQQCTVFEEFSLPDRKTIIDVCGGFARIDEETDRVVLVHLTVHEYLLRKLIVSEDAEFRFAMGCTTFLSYDVFEKPCEVYHAKLVRERSSYPFINYAATEVQFHLQACDEAMMAEIVFRFLSSPGNVQSYVDTSTMMMQERHWETSLWKSRPTTGPLQIATVWGSERVIEMLLDSGANIEHNDSWKGTCLHYAVIMGCTEFTGVEHSYESIESIIRLLIGRGAKVSAPNSHGQSPLHLAVEQQVPVVSLLLEMGADLSAVDATGRTPLYISVALENESITRMLLDGGADVSTAGPEGQTPLHIALKLGNEAMTKLLLEKDPNLEAVDDLGRTPLFTALQTNDNTITQLLLEKGAKALSEHLHISVGLGNGEATQLLLENGATISKAQELETLLHEVVVRGDISITELLLEQASKISDFQVQAATLHEAVWHSDMPTTKLLLEKGANISEAGLFNRTALHISVRRGHEAMCKLLLDEGANLLAADQDGQTPLHLSAEALLSPEGLLQGLSLPDGPIKSINRLLVCTFAKMYSPKRMRKCP